MNRPGEALADKAAELRHAFDRSFAQAVHAETVLFDDFLAIRLRADPHVLPLAGVARLLPVPALTRFPSAVPEWLGLVGLAGAAVPVYDLGMLLGYPAGDPPRWMAICTALPVALAFDAFDGQFRHPREPGHRLPDAGISSQREVLRTADQVRPVVPIASILATIKSRVLDSTLQKER
jgi:chemotaxis signal transduction protein